MMITRSWLIAGLSTVAMGVGTAQGQVTLFATSYVECLAQENGFLVSSGQILPVFNVPLQVSVGLGNTSAVADVTFNSSPGYALMRIDLDQVRNDNLLDNAQTESLISFSLDQSLAYELTGEFVYLGNEASHYAVILNAVSPTTPIYSGTADMSSSGTATVGSLPIGPGGPTTGFIGPGNYTVILESFIQASSGLAVASATGFVQLELGELPCPADFDSDTSVNVDDLITLLAGWGPNPGHVADINDDGNVNVDDLIALLAAWGACP